MHFVKREESIDLDDYNAGLQGPKGSSSHKGKAVRSGIWLQNLGVKNYALPWGWFNQRDTGLGGPPYRPSYGATI